MSFTNLPCSYAPECTYETATGASVDQALKLLEMHERARHTPAQTHTTAARAAVEKFRRPTISIGRTSEDWLYFETRWSEFTQATKLPDTDRVLQLLECCDDELRRDLTRAAGGTLTTQSETQVLSAIRRLAVREENPMVARFSLHQMHQESDEPVRGYGARIKGQASTCKFNLSCPACQAPVDYSDEVLRDVLVQGLADQEIQLDVLGDKNQAMSLEEVFSFVESKEAGKRSASKLLHVQGAHATRSSSYRQASRRPSDPAQAKRPNNQPLTKHPPARGPVPPHSLTSEESCSYCGRRGHGKKAPPSIRKTACPAFGRTCTQCSKPHHFRAVCRGQEGVNEMEEGAIFEELCSASNLGDTSTHTDSRRTVMLEHHLYDHLQDCWTRKSSLPQPYVDLHITAAREDYEALGFLPPSTGVRGSTLPVMADTGCQSSLAGVQAVRRLGIRTQDLIPVRMRMHAANERPLHILGATVLRFHGRDPGGRELQTRQLVYVTNSTSKIYLSREGCVALGLISRDFPTVGEASAIQQPEPQSDQVPRKDDNATCEPTINGEPENGGYSAHDASHHTARDGVDTACDADHKATGEPAPSLRPADGDEAECDCPRRQLPPLRPERLPFSPTEENRERLQQWLVDYYGSSTFNTCEHQSLPMMASAHDDGRGRDTDGVSQGDPSPHPLARPGEGGPRQRRPARRHRTGARRGASNMVPSYGGDG